MTSLTLFFFISKEPAIGYKLNDKVSNNEILKTTLNF